MHNKDIGFSLVKQAAFIEFELAGMEKTFRFMLDNFGDEAACKLFAEKKAEFNKWNAIKDSLDRLFMLQKNLDRAGEGLFEKLSTEQLPEDKILDAVIEFNSNKTKR